MSFELHIWGPAFGLASIDPECLAATAYLKSALPSDQWLLVPSYDPSWTPTGDFPILKDGSSSIGGYRAIVQYLEAQGWSLDTSLTKEQGAHHTALAAHLSAHALPLLDSLLYTTPDSYVHTTRPAWSNILPRSASLTIPSLRFSAAEARTASSGISFPSDAVGDIETSDDPNDPQAQQQRAAALQSNSPSLLFSRKRTLQAVIRKEAAATRFRLESMVGHLVKPLEAILELKHESKQDKISRVHCLAFGYLAILFYAPVPHPWFAETITAQYPHTVNFITRMRASIFDLENIETRLVMSQAPTLHSSEPSQISSSLPWRRPQAPSMTAALTVTLRQALSFIISPVQRWLLFADPQSRPGSSVPSLPILGLAAAPPLLTGIAYFVYTTFFSPSASPASFWGGAERDKHFGRPLYANKLEGLGEAGAMLSFLGGV